MKYSILTIFLCVSMVFAASQMYLVGDLSDPEQIERNETAINQNFEILWNEKLNVGGYHSRPRFTFNNLGDENMAEQNAWAINAAFDDLWIGLVDIAGSSGQRTYTIDDILNPDKAEENAFAINQNFADLRDYKEDS